MNAERSEPPSAQPELFGADVVDVSLVMPWVWLVPVAFVLP